MRSKKRGLALIINNRTFEDHEQYETREGSEIDASNLSSLFEQLGFEVFLKIDLRRQDLQRCLTEFTENHRHREMDACVVVIMSHGMSTCDQNGYIYCGSTNIVCTDGYKIPLENILSQFDNAMFPVFMGKPKMFFIQACRGENKNYGTSKLYHKSDGGSESNLVESEVKEVLPRATDMFIAYATIPGHEATRNTLRGSWFIQCVLAVFMERACDLELSDLMRLVAKYLAKYEAEGTKQSCDYILRGYTKKLYFNPGLG